MKHHDNVAALAAACLSMICLPAIAGAQRAKSQAAPAGGGCCGNGACCAGMMSGQAGVGKGMQRGPGMGAGRMGAGRMGAGMGRGMGSGMGGPQGRMAQDPTRRQDMAVFHFLVDSHKKIRRTVKQLDNGVETVTESDDKQVAAKIKEHVPAMYSRLKDGRGVHLVDPLFVALFQHGKEIDSQVSFTEKGVKVVETSKDPYTVKLIKAHAKSVDELVAKGRAAMAPHEVPKRSASD